MLCIMSSLVIRAQDNIIKRNGEEIKAKILEITPTMIKYKRFDYLDGPTISVLKSDILMIRYKNGSKEIFSEPQSKKKLELFNLKSGTLIPIKILGQISSDKKMPSKAIVSQDIIDKNGNVLISYGALVGMNIIANRSKAVGKPGTINIEFTLTTAVDGQKIKLTGNKFLEGEDKATLSKVLTGVGCLIIPPFNFLFLLIKGEPVVIPDNMIVYDVSVASSYNIMLE